jgi:dTDP-4-dehydrorhamnose reductase
MNKKTVAILGATGMLGSALYKELKDRYRLIMGVRSPSKLALLEQAYGKAPDTTTILFDAEKLYQEFVSKEGHAGRHRKALIESLDAADYVINAIGVTIPFSLENPALTFFVNGALPHLLAFHFGERLIHITTDCVYNGVDGFPYDERSPKTATDIYGLSKSLGEPKNCLTIRTSIVGREVDGFRGLLEWFLLQKGKSVKGFAGHFWNGVTTRQFARICDAIITAPQAFPKAGLYHVFTEPVSKYDMLLAFRERFNIDCDIVPDSENRLNRTLTTVRSLNGLLNNPSFHRMVEEM